MVRTAVNCDNSSLSTGIQIQILENSCHRKHIWKLPASQECLPSELANSLILTNEKIGPESDLFKLLWVVCARTKIKSSSSGILCRTFSLTRGCFFLCLQLEDKKEQHRTKIVQFFMRGGSLNFVMEILSMRKKNGSCNLILRKKMFLEMFIKLNIFCPVNTSPSFSNYIFICSGNQKE